jgi:hypothetical protein
VDQVPAVASDEWRSVGPGFTDVNAFLRSVPLSAFNIKDKAKLHARIKELQPDASTRAIGEATGASQSTVSRDLRESDDSASPPAPPPDQARPKLRESSDSPEPAGPLQRPPDEVAKAADKAARKEQAAAATKERREESRATAPVQEALDYRVGDCREILADVADNSVALVLTDPPYGDEARPLYEWLGKWAARVLIPGGSLICYTGQSRLDQDMQVLGENLRGRPPPVPTAGVRQAGP